MTVDTKNDIIAMFKSHAAKNGQTEGGLSGNYLLPREEGLLIVPVQCFLAALRLTNPFDLVSDTNKIRGR
jgi:hypothetical protein